MTGKIRSANAHTSSSLLVTQVCSGMKQRVIACLHHSNQRRYFLLSRSRQAHFIPPSEELDFGRRDHRVNAVGAGDDFKDIQIDKKTHPVNKKTQLAVCNRMV